MKPLSLAVCCILFSFSARAGEICEPLEKRLTVTDVPVQGRVSYSNQGVHNNPATLWEGAAIEHIVLSIQPNQKAKVAWMDKDTDSIRVTAIDESFKPVGSEDFRLNGELRDIVAHDEGAAVLHLHGGRMVLTRLDSEGKSIFSKRNLGSLPSTRIHMGSLAYDGKKYATYYGTTTGHEGDSLNFHSPSGASVSGGWQWGCSHSIDQRVILKDGKFVSLCISDAFPSTGFFFNHTYKIAYAWGDRSGNTDGRIGGLVDLGKNVAVAYTQGGTSYIQLRDATTFALIRKWPIATNGGVNLKVARYGKDQVLVSWFSPKQKQQVFWVYNSDLTQVVEAIHAAPVKAYARSDFKTFANGDVAWASVWGDTKALKLMRLKACQ